jgi:hypothetical protein
VTLQKYVSHRTILFTTPPPKTKNWVCRVVGYTPNTKPFGPIIHDLWIRNMGTTVKSHLLHSPLAIVQVYSCGVLLLASTKCAKRGIFWPALGGSCPLFLFLSLVVGAFIFIKFRRVSSSLSFYQRIETSDWVFFMWKFFKLYGLTLQVLGLVIFWSISSFLFHVNFLFSLLVGQYLRFWVSCLSFFFFFLFFLLVKCVQQRCLLCKNVLKVNGCSSSLQNFLSMFFLKTFLSTPFSLVLPI